MDEKYITSEDAVGAGCPHTALLSFTLPTIMNIETAEHLVGELRKLPSAQNTDLVLDASHVESLTIPGIQLLVSLEKSLTANGGKLTINQRSDSFIYALKDTGFYVLFSKSS